MKQDQQLSHRMTYLALCLMGIVFVNSPSVWAQSDASLLPGDSGLTTEQLNALLKQHSQTGSGRETSAKAKEPNTPASPSQVKLPPEGPSPVELMLSGKSLGVSKDLKQFGYDVFQNSVSTFAPVTNVPVGPDYIVGPGDSFTVTMWGRHNDRITVTVGRDGNIALPEVGVLAVSGMTFGKLQDYLKSELDRKFTDFHMHVAMGQLRTITVYVVGAARAPGSYTLSSLSTVINALFAAGGPSKNGSLRNITLRRMGQKPQIVDLYDFLMGGDKSGDVRLQDGDTIYIPLIGPVVGIAGNVKRPAIYEMKQTLTLEEALKLAGNVDYAGMLQRIQVERVQDHARRIVVDFNLSQPTSPATSHSPLATKVSDGDLIKVFPVLDREENVVYLEGHVLRPGKYELKPGMKLSDLFDHSYDLFKPQVNLEHAEIERKVPPDLHPITIPFNLGSILKGDLKQDYALQPLDTIHLYRWDQKGKRGVRVSGMVYEPNEYRFVDGMRVRDLIEAAGGLRQNSYLRTAEITRYHANQSGMTTEKINFDLAQAMAGDPNQNIVLQDNDHLVVRPIPDLNFNQTVDVTGEVRFPGSYPISKGEHLSSVLARAGGFTKDAYLKGAVFTRDSARAVQQQRMDDLIRQMQESLLTTTSKEESTALDTESAKLQKAGLEARKELIAKLKSARVNGRVVIKLTAKNFKNSKYDLVLENGDILNVPRLPGIVNIVGEVFNPTALLYEPDQTVSEYLARVGGMTKDADKKQVSVIRADGSVISMSQKSRQGLAWDNQNNQWIFGGNFMSTRLDPGDTIVVPKKLDYNKWLRTTKDLTQIVFQMALAAGVVVAL